MTVLSAAVDIAAIRRRLDSAGRSEQLRPVGLGAVHLGPNALEMLPAEVARLTTRAGGADVVLLSDATPKTRDGADAADAVCRLLSDHSVRRIVLDADPSGDVHADVATVLTAVRGAEGGGCLVTLGSGTVADIGKVVAAELAIPHVVAQTACSVNGFADDQSVLLQDGVKRTTPSRWPDVLLIDTGLLVAAPRTLNLAGIGDLAAMFTAPADWQLAYQLGMADTYSPAVVALAREHGAAVLECAAGVAAAQPRALETVATVLALSGISMGAAGTTAPSSGMEHTVSHLIDMAMARRGRRTALHGAQVGVCTIVAAVLWRRVLARVDVTPLVLRVPDATEMEGRVRTAFGALDPSGEMGEECWRLYARKLRRWAEGPAGVRAPTSIDVPALAALLADPAMICASLTAGGAPVRFGQLDPAVDESLVRWALLNCHLMRDRFTVADLAFVLGMWEEDDVEAVLHDAAALGGGA